MFEQILANVNQYVDNHPPDTGYTKQAIKAVVDAANAGQFQDGTNIGVQFLLQFDGKETSEDLVMWHKPEKQMPYIPSWSTDKGADCVDAIRNFKLALVKGENPGDWSEGMWQQWHTKFIPWEERRPLDAILYKIGNRNPHATHGSILISREKMMHTTSKSNAWRVENASWRRSNVVGVCRIFTDEDYKSLIVGGVIESEESDMLDKKNKEEVYEYQHQCKKAGHNPLKSGETWLDMKTGENNGCDGSFGPYMELVTASIQDKHGLPKTGDPDFKTMLKVASEIKGGREDRAALEEIMKIAKGAL